ncbi:MAG TPA: MFS transporter [Amycolatopsis sp.]|nr:MFS transporter [Amycolatopsis sp.]
MSDEIPDVRRELDSAPLRPFHWLVVGLASLATLFDGYDTFIPSYMIHFVTGPWHLSLGAAGFLVSSGLIGFAVGSLTHGIVADRFGRRPTLIGGLFVAGVFSALTGLLGTSYPSFLALRVVTGLGLGVLMPLGTAYVNEYLPHRVHNRLAVLSGAGFVLGGVLASLFGLILTEGGNWRVLYYLGGGAVVLGLIYLPVFPESAEFLVARGKITRAVRLMERIRPDRAGLYRSAGLRASAPRQDWRPALTRTLTLALARRYRVRTFALWASAFFLLFDVYGLTTWIPQLMIQRGHGFATGYSFGAVLQLMSIIGAIAGGFVADRYLGARRSLMLWCALGAVATLVIAFAGGTVVDLVSVGCTGLFVIGGQFLLNNICAQTYPVQARGTGEGLMLGFGRAGGILGPYLGGWLLGVFGGTAVLFVALAVAAALAVGTTAFVTDRGDGPAPAVPAPEPGVSTRSGEA